MGRWDIAEWVGPTPNRVSGGMLEYRGLVVHIMQGTYDGSIGWMKNPASSVSSHFATRSDGHLAQVVDTNDAAWTQAAGNGHWLSIENEGYSGNPLTPGQVEAVAQVYARGVLEYGWPLQTTDSPNGYGLGWHGMGGIAWGNHPDCPGEPIKAQRGQVLARAAEILNPTQPSTEEDHMTVKLINVNNPTHLDHGKVFKVYPTDLGMAREWLPDELGAAVALWGGQVDVSDPDHFGTPIEQLRQQWTAMGGTSGTGPTLDAIRTVVDEELDEQSRAGADND